ncbi:MAG: DUF4157 domain-containing protein [Myxococcaceae bacterium]
MHEAGSKKPAEPAPDRAPAEAPKTDSPGGAANAAWADASSQALAKGDGESAPRWSYFGKAAAPDSEAEPAHLGPARRGLASASAPLEPSRRSYFEQRYGADFSGVRVHQGGEAAESAAALDASAFTVGQHVVLGSAAAGGGDDSVIAHELAHVVQQSRSSEGLMMKSLQLGAAGDSAERGADAAASAAMQPGAGRVDVGGSSGPNTLRLKPKKGKQKPPKKKPAGTDDFDGYEMMYVEPVSANVLASRTLAATRAIAGSDFVLLVVTDAVYVYSADGKIVGTFKLTGAPRAHGLYQVGHDKTLGLMEKPGVGLKWVSVAWEDEDVQIERWADLPEKTFTPLITGKHVFVVIPNPPADPDKGGGSADAPNPDYVPNPDANPAAPGAGVGTGSATAEPLKQPLSGDEYLGDPDATGDANYPAFPASIQTDTGLIPTGGLSELTMHLDWTYGERELIGAVWNASTPVKYHWSRWDISSMWYAGQAEREKEARQKRQAAPDSDHEVDDEYNAHDRAERRRILKEDRQGSRDRIASPDPDASPEEQARDRMVEVNNLAGAPTSAIVSAVGGPIDELWHTVTKPDNEINLWWNWPGHYLVRCVATPKEHRGRRYMSSVATVFVEVRDPSYIAKNTLGSADATIDELKVAKEAAHDDKKKAELQAKIDDLNTSAHGSAVDALELAVKNKQAEVDSAVGRAKERRTEELQSLTRQLEFAKRNEKGITNGVLGTDGKTMHAYRPEAAFASRVTGTTYPLVLQLRQLSTGKRPKWAVYDVTGAGDNLGHAYVGEGHDDTAAITRAFKRFAGENEYGRGTMVAKVPGAAIGPGVSDVVLELNNVPVGDGLARERLHDLMAVLIVLGLFIPGVGEAAMVIGATAAAAHLIQRWQDGNLQWDASLVSDLLAIVGAVGLGVGAVGKLAVIDAGEGYALALESGDQAAIKAAFKGLDRAALFAKGAEFFNTAVGYGMMAWSDIQTMDELRHINEDEDEGKITHAEARSKRAKAVLGALQNHAMVFGAHGEGEASAKDEAAPKREAAAKDEPVVKDEQAPRQEAPTADENAQKAKPADEPVTPKDEAAQPTSSTDSPAAEPKTSGEGAVKGKESYPLRKKGKKLKVDDAKVKKAIKRGGTAERLSTTTGEAELTGSGAKGEYKLEIGGPKGSKGKSKSVKVKVEMVEGFDAASKPHGGDEGPVRLELTRSGGEWQATIKVHEMASEGDLSQITGHELDEIVDIVRNADPAWTDAEAKTRAEEQMKAEVFRPGIPSKRPMTAHDRAAARELAHAYRERAAARDNGNKAKEESIQKRIDAMEKSMGLDDPAAGFQRAEALEQLGLFTADQIDAINDKAQAARWKFPAEEFTQPGQENQWVKKEPKGKPALDEKGGVAWRYDRYRYDKWVKAGKPKRKPKKGELLDPKTWFDKNIEPQSRGQSRGERGSPEHERLVLDAKQINGLPDRPPTKGGWRPDAFSDQPGKKFKVPVTGEVIDPGKGNVIYEADNFFSDGSQLDTDAREQVRGIRKAYPDATIVVQDVADPRNVKVYKPGEQPPPEGRLPADTPEKVKARK